MDKSQSKRGPSLTSEIVKENKDTADHINFKPKFNQIKYLNEGQIWKGNFEGFVRSIDASGGCQLGYWSTRVSMGNRAPSTFKTDHLKAQSPIISRPFGKWAHYDTTGKPIGPEGIYRGDNR